MSTTADGKTYHQPEDPIFRTKAGLLKRRFTYKEKVLIVGNGESFAATQDRLEAFGDLFAFRKTGAGITKEGKGPRAWTTLPELLKNGHIIQHLSANRIPTKAVRWVAARCFDTVLFFLHRRRRRPRAWISTDG